MGECRLARTCLFFQDKMGSKQALGDIYKKRYCLGDYTICARYLVCSKLGRSAVPSDLYPNQSERAQEMIKGS